MSYKVAGDYCETLNDKVCRGLVYLLHSIFIINKSIINLIKLYPFAPSFFKFFVFLNLFFSFRCIMLGEHRQLLADLLLTKKTEFNGDQQLAKMIKDDIKSLEDITSKAKNILRKQSIKGGSSIEDAKEENFMRILFSYHPTRKVNEQSKIVVGMCQG